MKKLLTKELLKLKGPSPLKNEYKESLKLSKEQRCILVGTLLGDAHLEPKGIDAYRYYFCQKDSQEDYVKHIHNWFQDWCSTDPAYSKTGLDKEGKITRSCYFRTCTHPSFRFYANQFYEKGMKGKRTKKVPKLLHKWLTPRALAYWFMDDGCRDKYSYILNTQNFTLKEQEVLADALGRKFKFQVNIHKDRDTYRLYITSNSRDSLTNVIKPFIKTHRDFVHLHFRTNN